MDEGQLKYYGIDINKGLVNCMGNRTFYKKILGMFLQDKCFENARSAFEADDSKALFARMHEMKGISGNAALTQLYADTVKIVELLRNDGASREETTVLFKAVEQSYERACEGIRKLIAEA